MIESSLSIRYDVLAPKRTEELHEMWNLDFSFCAFEFMVHQSDVLLLHISST